MDKTQLPAENELVSGRACGVNGKSSSREPYATLDRPNTGDRPAVELNSSLVAWNGQKGAIPDHGAIDRVPLASCPRVRNKYKRQISLRPEMPADANRTPQSGIEIEIHEKDGLEHWVRKPKNRTGVGVRAPMFCCIRRTELKPKWLREMGVTEQIVDKWRWRCS